MKTNFIQRALLNQLNIVQRGNKIFLTLTAILLELSSLITANSWQTPGGVRWFPPKAEKSYRVILTLWVGSTSITQGWYDVPQPVSAVTALDRYPLGPGTWIAYEAWHCCLLADTTTRKRNVFVLISSFKKYRILRRLFQDKRKSILCSLDKLTSFYWNHSVFFRVCTACGDWI